MGRRITSSKLAYVTKGEDMNRRKQTGGVREGEREAGRVERKGRRKGDREKRNILISAQVYHRKQ